MNLFDWLIDPAATVFVLGIIIFFHEFGHFITAKAFGIRVFVFSFGFGPRLMGFKWGDTDCRLSAVPLGGYVKLEGEPDDVVSEDTSHVGDGRDFTSRPRWQRIVVYLAGPFMNGVLTVAVLAALYLVGTQVLAWRFERPVIGTVTPGSPATSAGLVTGDEIVAVDGKPASTWEDLLITVALRPETDLTLRYRRGTEEREVSLRTGTDKNKTGDIGVHPLVKLGSIIAGSPADKAGLKPEDAILRIDGKLIEDFNDIIPIVSGAKGRALDIEVLREGGVLTVQAAPNEEGKIGVGPKWIVKKFPMGRALSEAVRETGRMTVQTVTLLRQLLTLRISPKAALSGPVQIYQASGQAARSSYVSLFGLIALLSLSVGILNLVPLPPLDGGHLAILYVESIARRDLSLQAKAMIINVGAVMVLMLIASVVYFDISKMEWFEKLFPQ